MAGGRDLRKTGRGLAAALLFVVALAACDEQSRVAPDADISIQGLLRGPDNSPLPDRPVQLGLGVGTGDGAVGVLTLGLACLDGRCRGDVHDTKTDNGGRYHFTLKGRETQSSFGEARSVLLTASGAPPEGAVSGARVSARFRVQVPALQLPDLQLVDPALALRGDASVHATWQANRPGPYDLTFETDDVVPVWKVTTGQPGVTVDPRLLEDTAGRAVVSGAAEDRIEGSSLELLWRSPGIPFASAAGPPPSRGATCRFTATGVAAVTETACDLTDGDLSTPAAIPSMCPAPSGTAPPPTTGCPAATHVAIDLPRDVPAELVVVRGCEGGCAVAPGAGSVSEGFGALPLDGRPVRTVQVSLGTGSGLREISVWGPAPPRALQSLDQNARDRIGRPFGGRTGDGGAPRWLLVVGAVLAGLVLAATFYALGRRRSSSAI